MRVGRRTGGECVLHGIESHGWGAITLRTASDGDFAGLLWRKHSGWTFGIRQMVPEGGALRRTEWEVR